MLNNKNKKNTIYFNSNTPSIINKYNKFLTTIDNISHANNLKEQENETINSIIEKIESKFENGNLDSITGQSPSDLLLANLRINNPDIYVDNNQSNKMIVIK
jgi:hypothetical protein